MLGYYTVYARAISEQKFCQLHVLQSLWTEGIRQKTTNRCRFQCNAMWLDPRLIPGGNSGTYLECFSRE